MSTEPDTTAPAREVSGADAPESKPREISRGGLSRPIAEVAAPDTRWLIPGFTAAGMVTDLSGPPGTGKSVLTQYVAARASRGLSAPEHPDLDAPVGSIIIGSEDDPGVLKDRLEGMDADLDRIRQIDAVPDSGRPVDLTTDYEAIAADITALGAGLVIFDDAVSILGGMASNAAARRAMSLLARLGRETDAAIITIRHWSKRPTGTAVNAGIGSIGVTATARVATVVAPDPEDPDVRVWAVAKSNAAAVPPSLGYRVVEGPTGAAAIDWIGPVEWSANDLLRTNPTQTPKTTAAFDLLKDLLADGPVLRSEIQEAASKAGIGWRTVEAAKTALTIEARQIPTDGNPGRGPSWWALPDTDWPDTDSPTT